MSIHKIKWNTAQKLEIKWWERYLKNKDIDTYLKWKKSYWNDFIDQLKPEFELMEGMKILDAGCGPAGIFTVLNDCEVVAIDPLINQYEEKIEHFSKSKHPNVRFVNSGIENFSSVAKFDVIFCLNAINHVEDITTSNRNLRSWLKEGGTLIYSIDSHNYQPLKHLFRAIPADALHPHQYSLRDYENMLTDNQFEILKKVKLKKGFVFDYWTLVARAV